MDTSADSSIQLEIRIRPGDDSAYSVEARLHQQRDAATQAAPLELDLAQLGELRYDWKAYGRALAEMLFADAAIREAYRRARADAAERRARLRLILNLGAAADLHPIQWETLFSPEGEGPLALLPELALSRLLTSNEWRPLRPRPRGELRALALLGSVTRVGQIKAGPSAASQDQAALQSALGPLSHTILSGPNEATTTAMRQQLREGYDIFCLVAGGGVEDGRASLALAPGPSDDGTLPSDQLVRVLGGLLQPPRMVLLCSASGDADRDRALSDALGPRLLAAGIPLVLTLQGAPSSGMNARFLSTVLEQLRVDGQADRAVAEARRAVAEQADWWAPALLTRVRSALLWDAAGDADEADERPSSPEGRGRRAAAKGAAYGGEPQEPDDEDAGEVYQEVAPQGPYGQAPQGAYGQAPQMPLSEVPANASIEQTEQTVQGPGRAIPLSEAPANASIGQTEQTVQGPDRAIPLPAAAPDQPAQTEPAAPEAAASGAPDGAAAGGAGAALPAAPSAQPIMVLVQQLAARYEPPDATLCLEVYADHARFRFQNADYASPHRLAADAAELWASLTLDPQRHGEALFAAVFRDEPWDGAAPTRVGYEQARALSARELRIELNLRHRAFEQYRWEYLADITLPGHPPLATSPRSPLYRRPAVGTPTLDPLVAGPLKICVAMCSPPGLGDPAQPLLAGLEPLDLARQAEIIGDALEPLEASGLAERVLLGAPGGPPATLEAIGEALDAGCNVLHLLAHGVEVEGEQYLVIDHAIAGGRRPFVPAATFGAMLRGHSAALRLVVLASCRSAAAAQLGGGDSLGATLVEGGVPAVIGMQDLVAVNTVQFFTQHFYADLARSGRVEMAVAVTRYDLHQWLQGSSPDWGLPVLYMGPGNGRLFDVNLAQAAAKLAPRAPVIKSFARAAANMEEITRQVERIAEARQGGTVAPAQIEALRAAVAPGGAPAPQLAAGQRRELLSGLRRPLLIDSEELRRYVEQQADGLVLAPAVYRQAASALSNGKHVILTGPPGTGKTSVAHHISRFAVERGLIPGAITTTASADWTTFDTVGGYMPTPQGTLQFRAGIFLRAICDGQWLVIDEINRAEIDKAFGELFTVLSGQPVDLPFWVGEHQVRIVPGLRERDPARPWVPATVSSPYDYVVHPNWRIIGAMNVYDKSSLFAMSFAFMRRFAFVEIDVPPAASYAERLVRQWLGAGPTAERIGDELTAAVSALLGAETLMGRRALGPAIIMDMVRHAAHCAEMRPAEPLIDHVAEGFGLYAAPQLDALDQETVSAIYAELQGLYAAAGSGGALLARIRALYPHIRREEWPQG